MRKAQTLSVSSIFTQSDPIEHRKHRTQAHASNPEPVRNPSNTLKNALRNVNLPLQTYRAYLLQPSDVCHVRVARCLHIRHTKSHSRPIITRILNSTASSSSGSSYHSRSCSCSMCRVVHDEVIYSDGYRERKERIVPCRRATRSSICSNLDFGQDTDIPRRATAEEERDRMEPWITTAAPRPRPESSGRSETTSEASKPKNKIRKQVAKLFGIKEKPRYEWVRKRPQKYPLTYIIRSPKPSGEQRPSMAHEAARAPRGSETHESAPDPRTRRPRRRPEVEIIYPEEDDESSSSSEPDEKPHPRKSSAMKDPEANRANLREKEREKQKAKLHIQEAEAEAHARAQKLHEQEEERRARTDGKTRRDGRPASYHAIPDEPLPDDVLRAQQEQHEKDSVKLRAFDNITARQHPELWRHPHSSDTASSSRPTLRDELERERERTSRPVHRSESSRHQHRRSDDDASRLRRQREANIPRRPRHRVRIEDPRNSNSDPDSFEEQGDQFLESATRLAEQREAERRRPAEEWRGPERGGDGITRRNTVDGSQGEERGGRGGRGSHRRGRPSR